MASVVVCLKLCKESVSKNSVLFGTLIHNERFDNLVELRLVASHTGLNQIEYQICSRHRCPRFPIPMISSNSPSVSFSNVKMSARITSSTRSGCGL